MTSRSMKTGLGLVALLLPGGLLFLLGWVLVRALARANARERSLAHAPGEPSRFRRVLSHLSLREVVREARASF